MLDDRPYMRRSEYRDPWSMTAILLAVNVVCFVLQNVIGFYTNFPVERYLALSLEGLRHGQIYQLITFQFLHAGLFHLLGNCLGLFFFGRSMEDTLGRSGLLKLYLLSGTIGGLLQSALAFSFPGHFGSAVLGASAGVFGLIAAFATRSPEHSITMLIFFIFPVTFQARMLLFIEGAIAIFGILVPNGGIAHAAHLGGMFTGIAYIRWLSRMTRPVLKSRRRPPLRELVSTTQTKRSTWKRPAKTEEDLPPTEFISKEVDPILDKISAHGIQSLTDREKQILEAARKKMSKR